MRSLLSAVGRPSSTIGRWSSVDSDAQAAWCRGPRLRPADSGLPTKNNYNGFYLTGWRRSLATLADVSPRDPGKKGNGLPRTLAATLPRLRPRRCRPRESGALHIRKDPRPEQGSRGRPPRGCGARSRHPDQACRDGLEAPHRPSAPGRSESDRDLCLARCATPRYLSR